MHVRQLVQVICLTIAIWSSSESMNGFTLSKGFGYGITTGAESLCVPPYSLKRYAALAFIKKLKKDLEGQKRIEFLAKLREKKMLFLLKQIREGLGQLFTTYKRK